MSDRKTHLTKKTVKRIQANLVAWYRKNRRSLPWRETGDPYHIWVSEVMLQQTQVNTVIGYYRDFLGRFPTLEMLAEAEQQAVLKCWEGMGYYARARNLHRAAKIVVEQHDGNIPDDYKAFRQLPGVGDYIAAAVMSIAFKQPHAVVDGNVKRVLSRLTCMDTPVNASGAHKTYQSLATAILDIHRPETFNQAVMELGALVCRPDNPNCPSCPLSTDCLAFRSDTTGVYPHRKKSTPPPPDISPSASFAGGTGCSSPNVLPTDYWAGCGNFPAEKSSTGRAPPTPVPERFLRKQDWLWKQRIF